MDGRGDYSMLTKSDLEGLALAKKKINYYYKGTANNIKTPIIIDGVLSATEPWDFVKKSLELISLSDLNFFLE